MSNHKSTAKTLYESSIIVGILMENKFNNTKERTTKELYQFNKRDICTSKYVLFFRSFFFCFEDISYMFKYLNKV